MRFSSIESIVTVYRYYQIRQDIDTIKYAKVSILSNPPKYRYYRIGIDTFAITIWWWVKWKCNARHHVYPVWWINFFPHTSIQNLIHTYLYFYSHSDSYQKKKNILQGSKIEKQTNFKQIYEISWKLSQYLSLYSLRIFPKIFLNLHQNFIKLFIKNFSKFY